MTRYGVPVTGAVYVEVEAGGADDAREKAVEKALQMDPADLGLHVDASAELEIVDEERERPKRSEPADFGGGDSTGVQDL